MTSPKHPFPIGFTGAREGTTARQHSVLVRTIESLLELHLYLIAHHGDCIGSDAQFHSICTDLKIPIILHPPVISSQRAFSLGAILTLAPQSFIHRNHAIVNSTRLLIGAPSTQERRIRSGTWATIRYAEKLSHPVTIIFPDGTLESSPPK